MNRIYFSSLISPPLPSNILCSRFFKSLCISLTHRLLSMLLGRPFEEHTFPFSLPVGLLESFEGSPHMAPLGSLGWRLQERRVCAAPIFPTSHWVRCECGEKPPGCVLPKPRSALHGLPGAWLMQALGRKHRMAEFNQRLLLPHLCGQADKGGFPGSSPSLRQLWLRSTGSLLVLVVVLFINTLLWLSHYDSLKWKENTACLIYM